MAGSSSAQRRPSLPGGHGSYPLQVGEPATPTLARRAVGALAGRSLQQLGFGVSALTIVLAAALGGLDGTPGTVRGVVELEAGAPLELGPVKVVVERALVADELVGQYLSAEGNRWVGLVVTVEATDTRTVGSLDLESALRLRDVQGLVKIGGETVPAGRSDEVTPNEIVLLSDGQLLGSAQPGIAYEVVYLWEQAAVATPPDEMEVVAVGHTKRPSVLDRQLMWLDARDVAVGALPVEVVPPPEPTEPSA